MNAQPPPPRDGRELPAHLQSMLELPRYRPVNRRRRVLLALLAVATAVTVGWLMVAPLAQRKPALDAAQRTPRPCTEGQQTHCIGGKVDVIVAPASPPAAGPASR